MERSNDTIEELTKIADEDPGEAQQLFEMEESDDETENLETEDTQDHNELGGSFCKFCGRHANPQDESTFQEITTWVGGPKKDSALLRTYTGSVAHRSCIDLIRSGIAPSQQNLDELLDATPERADVADDIFTDKSIEWRTGFRHGHNGTSPLPPVGEEAAREYNDGYQTGAEIRPFGNEVDAQPDACPECDSPNPILHLAMRHEGKVQQCGHPWHLMT